MVLEPTPSQMFIVEALDAIHFILYKLSCMVGSRKGWVLELSTLTLFPRTCIGVPSKANASTTDNGMMHLHI